MEIAIGQRFGRRTVLKQVPRDSRYGSTWWSVRCDCGYESEVSAGNLKRGHANRCFKCAGNRLNHGHSVKKKVTRTYASWGAMLARCTKPSNNRYAYYGARGITICERWLTFENFLADMGECPAGLTLERKDTNSGYEPANCKWATRTEQMRNRQSTERFTYGGLTCSMPEWAERTGIPYKTLFARFSAGWSIERALTAPVRRWA